MYAAVGHDAWVSYVALSPASLVKTMPVSAMANSVVLAGNDYIYVLPFRYLRVSTGVEGLRATGSPNDLSPAKARMHPGGEVIFSTTESYLSKDDIRTAPHRTISLPVNIPTCGKFWYFDQGARLLTSCSTVLRPNTDPESGAIEPAGVLARSEVSTSSGTIAAAAQTGISPLAVIRTSTEIGDQLAFHDTATLAWRGSVALGTIPANNQQVAIRGQYAFYHTDGSRITVIGNVLGFDMANPVLTWYVRTFDTQAGSGSCPVTLTAASTVFPAQGGSLDVSIGVPENCLWTLQRSSPWISVLGGYSGFGPRTVSVYPPSSGGTSPQNYKLDTGGTSLQFTQAPYLKPNYRSIFPFPYVASAYDRVTDRLIAVSRDPDQLYVWSTTSGGVTGVIDLPRTPLTVALSADGAFAAVGHHRFISYVDLRDLTSAPKLFPIGISALHLAVTSGYAHASEGFSRIVSVNLSTGAVSELVQPLGIVSGRLKLQPGTAYLYGGLAVNAKYDGSKAPVAAIHQRSTSTCHSGKFWCTETGDRLLTSCATVHRTSEIVAEDLAFQGRLAGLFDVSSAAHSSFLKMFAVSSGGSEVQLLSDKSFNVTARKYYEALPVSNAADQYFSADAARLYGLLTTSNNPQFAIETLLVGGQAGQCAVTLGAAPEISGWGGVGAVPLTSDPDCIWRATSSEPWIHLVNATAVGSGSVRFTVAANYTTVPRTGKITINGVDAMIMQGPGPIPPGGAPLPQSMDPSTGSIGAQTFLARFTGAAGLATAYISFGNAPAGEAGCTVEFTKATGSFRILNDAALNWNAAVSGKLSNSQCTVDGPSFVVSGDSLVITLPVTFQPAFYGYREVYLLSNQSGWRRRGAYTIGAAAAEIGVRTMLPESGAGPANTFTAVFTHSGGADQHYLGYMLFLRTPNIVWYTAKNSCLVEYNRISNGMRLINDAGDGWLGGESGITLGTPGASLSNAQCSVNIAAATAKVAGMTMTVTVPVRFVSSSPVSATFLQAFDVTGKYTGMTQVGNWVTGLPSTTGAGPAIGNVAVLPDVGHRTTILASASHTAGVPQLSSIHLRFGTSITAPGPCHIIYFPGENSLNLIADSEVALVGPNVPLGTAKVLSNSRCSVNAATVSRVLSGNEVTLTLPVTFAPASFDGVRFLYVNAFDNYGNLTHWVTGGTIRVQ